MEKVLAIDIGGTNVKVGLFSPSGQLEAKTRIPTGKLTDGEAFARVTDALIGFLGEHGASSEDVVGVGLDVPGPVDASGKVGLLPNIELDPDGLITAVRASFPRAAIALANDASAAALGEFCKGAGAAANADSFVMVAIGTGVGGGVILDGKLVPGAFGAGGEVGHFTVNRDEAAVCGCGRHGCLERYASASGIVRVYQDECTKLGRVPATLAGPTDTLAVFEAHRAGDEAARKAVSVMCDTLGFVLAQISTMIDPGLFVIGGGVGEGFDLFADELRAAFRRYCLPTCAGTRIQQAQLGNDAALYGCAFLVMR